LALFKIEKGLKDNLTKNRPNITEGYCYFTTDDGKFYIDTDTKRICLNAARADISNATNYGECSTAGNL